MKKIIPIICIMALFGCTKTAPESATEAALNQANAIEAKINKECPQVEMSLDIMALKSTIKNQLSSCEDRMQIYRERNNTLWLALIALVAFWVFANWTKIKARIIK